MATLSEGGRISEDEVKDEILRLIEQWTGHATAVGTPEQVVIEILGSNRASKLDQLEKYTLAGIQEVCRQSSSMAEAGRKLFNVSRLEKKSNNDSHRLKQLLIKYGLNFEQLRN
jgi:transcriptional regulatory protein RtcR